MRLAGWSWDHVTGEQSAGEVTWGGPYRIVGSYVDGVFTTTQRPEPAPRQQQPGPVVFPMPCPEPAGAGRPSRHAGASRSRTCR